MAVVGGLREGDDARERGPPHVVRVEVGEHHVGDIARLDPDGAEVGQEGATREPGRRLGAVTQIDQDEAVPAADEKAPDRHVQPTVVAQQRRVLGPVDLASSLGARPRLRRRTPKARPGR